MQLATLKHCAESSGCFHLKIKRIKQETIICIKKMKGRDISIALSLAYALFWQDEHLETAVFVTFIGRYL